MHQEGRKTTMFVDVGAIWTSVIMTRSITGGLSLNQIQKYYNKIFIQFHNHGAKCTILDRNSVTFSTYLGNTTSEVREISLTFSCDYVPL